MSSPRDRGTPVVIHRSLTDEILLGGVPRTLALFNGTIGASLGIGGGAYYILPIFIITHMVLARIHKNDSQYLECLRRHFYINRGYYRA